MRYMDNAQLDALTEQIAALSRMRDKALQNWAREALVEFCQTANIDPKLIKDEGNSAGLEIPLDEEAKITLYVSGYNYPDVGVSISIEPVTLGGWSVFAEDGIPNGLAELARRMANEAEYTRNKADRQESILKRVNAVRATLPNAPPEDENDTEDDGA